MGKIIIANITWNSNDWKGWDPKYQDISGHRYVIDGNRPHESDNFNLDKEYNQNELNRIYGFIQFNKNPKIEGDKNLIIFYSQKKIVGFYGRAGLIGGIWNSEDRIKVENMNVYGDKDISFVLKNKIENIKEYGFLEDKKRIGQIGFNYINHRSTVIDILKKAIKLNPNQSTEIKKLKEWILDEFPSSSPSFKNGSTKIKFPKNLILYGPPGTGKTYNTKIKAVQIIENIPDNELSTYSIDLIYEKYDDYFSNGLINFTTFHQSFSYEQFIEGIKVETDKETQSAIYKIEAGIFKEACEKCEDITSPVVFIIDEINRGNISKIMGELITLIETDKRWGMEEQISIKLPYSKQDFNVPKNLYIIGTMNTADRSLVQLDTALRRRFDFEEMMPCYDDKLWINKDLTGFDLRLFLQKLNDKIIKEFDREHQIGHSYLMNVSDIKELQRKWENQIMPLLQEYFYDSYEKLAKVIGEDSAYLKKHKNDNDYWELNMKVGEGKFKDEFQKVFDFVIDKPEPKPNTENN